MLNSTPLNRRWPASEQISAIHSRFWATSKIMTLFFYSSFAFVLIGVLGLAFDSRQILNMPAWAKTTKFALSFLLYAPTVLWMFRYMTGRPRLRPFLLTACGIMLYLEMAL